MLVILLLTTYRFLPVAILVKFTGQLHFNCKVFCLPTNQMKCYFYNVQQNLKDLNNME